MHSDRLTNKSQQAFAAALSIARARRNPQVTPAHLLVSLLEQEGGIVVPVLQRAKADPEGIRRRANEQLDKLPKVTGSDSDGPGFSGDVSKLLQQLLPRDIHGPQPVAALRRRYLAVILHGLRGTEPLPGPAASWQDIAALWSATRPAYITTPEDHRIV